MDLHWQQYQLPENVCVYGLDMRCQCRFVVACEHSRYLHRERIAGDEVILAVKRNGLSGVEVLAQKKIYVEKGFRF